MEPSVNLCMGCMNELDADGHCHYCSYSDDIPHLQSYLAPKTMLDNRYVVGKMLSYNGEGASYICYDTVGKCKCVCREYMPDTLCERESDGLTIKVNPDCLAKYKTFMSEFADMNRVLSKMRNLTHIVTAKDMFVENNTTYVILEYVEGVSLKKFLQSNTGFLTWEQVKKLFVPLFTTLNIIHNEGIIHRGISPENIIVTTEGELKLTGFCISSIRTSNTGLMPEFYSGYTAPEQYSSLQWQGTWTDVYAVSAVIYRILTGCMPLDANTRIHNDTLVEANRVNPRIPMHISNVLQDAMAVKGEERIQTVTELVTSLFEKQPARMEHEKGATQTIPIAHVPNQNRRYDDYDDYDDEYDDDYDDYDDYDERPVRRKKKKGISISMIIGWIIVLAVITLGIILLIQMFQAPDEEDASSNRSVQDYSFAEDSEEEKYEFSTTTTEPVESVDENEYGYGELMPNLTGQIYSQVEKKVGDKFTLKKKLYFSDSDEIGLVRWQSIPEGKDYDPSLKNELVLEVCAGSPSIPVPDYAGYDKRSYLQLLDSLFIKYKVVNEKSATVDVDYVIRTSINPGSMINIENEEELTVYVCDGKITTTAASTSPTSTSTTTSLSEWTDTEPVWTAPSETEPLYTDPVTPEPQLTEPQPQPETQPQPDPNAETPPAA